MGVQDAPVPSQDPEQIWTEAVKSSVLLRHLAPHEVKSMRTSCKVVKVRANMVIYKQGSYADCFYVIQTGRYHASIEAAINGTGEERHAREYGQGDTFGSYELLFPGPRSATLTCIEAGSIWTIEKRIFTAKIRDSSVPPSPALMDFIRSVHLFADLDAEHIVQLSRAANEINLEPKQQICAQGQIATTLYAVRSGSLITSQSDSNFKYTMTPPECMGESALYPEEELRVRKATVCATDEGAVVLSFEVLDIEAVIGFALQEQAVRTYNRKLLSSVRFEERLLTQDLSKKHIDWVVDALREEQYSEGFIVACEGNVDETLYIVKRGRASVYRDNVGEVAQLSAGDFFGEMSLVGRRTRRTASIVAKGPLPLTLLELPSSALASNSNLDQWRFDLMVASGMHETGGTFSPDYSSASERGKRRPPPKRRLSYAERIAEAQTVVYKAAAAARRKRAETAMRQHQHDARVLDGRAPFSSSPQTGIWSSSYTPPEADALTKRADALINDPAESERGSPERRGGKPKPKSSRKSAAAQKPPIIDPRQLSPVRRLSVVERREKASTNDIEYNPVRRLSMRVAAKVNNLTGSGSSSAPQASVVL